uniref:Uncharacterized protein n=1 Tax=Oryza punctata TaxID=4537 RepID=A0A0E0KFR8_ORYPU
MHLTVDDGGQRVVRTREDEEDISVVETKVLLQASLPDAGATPAPTRKRCSPRPRATTGDCSTSATLTEQANDQWLLPHNTELISIPHRCILP